MKRINVASSDAKRKFDRVARLIGNDGLEKLKSSYVLIIGLGGVGSFAAESLIRSGIGTLGLVDFDQVCIMNFNRQIQALDGSVGQYKAELLAERCRQINPEAEIICHTKFFNRDSTDFIFERRPDFVIDAIDHVTAKCVLLNHCRTNKIPVVSSTGSGGRLDPTKIRITDLGETDVDQLARWVRKILRRKFNFPRNGKFGIPAVYSIEPAVDPRTLPQDNVPEMQCSCPKANTEFQSCKKRNLIRGTTAFVTGSFGMTCASVAVRHLLGTFTYE